MSVPKGYEGRCLSCKYYKTWDGGDGCGNKERLKEFENHDWSDYEKKWGHKPSFNMFFSARFEGVDCDYYEYDE